VADALPSLITASRRPETTRISLNTNGASLLAFNFNLLWCNALNQRESKSLTHFAMHHADIQAQEGWLDVLIDEMQRVEADVLSVVIPIKDGKGLTSTGLQDQRTGRIRRLTMTEVNKLPKTFNAHDCHDEFSNTSVLDHLLINTGLWICDFTKPWVEQVHFTINDAIVQMPDGKFTANVMSEDWNFSTWCHLYHKDYPRRLRLFATTAVSAHHHGTARFSNTHPWGDWTTDLGDKR